MAKVKKIKCPFCDGTGVDPFGIMSELSTCPVCKGRGEISVREPYVECKYCGGSGVEPGTRLTCSACSGKGVHHVEEPTEVCPVCEGTGETENGFHCLFCGGAGVVAKKKAVKE